MAACTACAAAGCRSLFWGQETSGFLPENHRHSSACWATQRCSSNPTAGAPQTIRLRRSASDDPPPALTGSAPAEPAALFVPLSQVRAKRSASCRRSPSLLPRWRKAWPSSSRAWRMCLLQMPCSELPGRSSCRQYIAPQSTPRAYSVFLPSTTYVAKAQGMPCNLGTGCSSELRTPVLSSMRHDM